MSVAAMKRQTETPTDIFANAVCISVTLSSFGNTRKISTSQIEVEADKKMVKAQKTLVDSPELEEIKSLYGKIGAYMRKKALPSMFRAGVYLLPLDLVETVDEQLGDFQSELERLLDKLEIAWDKRVETSLKALNKIGDKTDYPTSKEMRSYFGIAVKYVEFGVPGKLASISKRIFDRERDNAKRDWDNALLQARQMLAVEFAGLVDHMIERVTDTSDGKKKKFYDSLVTNMNEFLETFEAKNKIINSPDLRAQIEKAKKVMSGVGIDAIKKSEDVRENLKKGFEDVKKVMDKFVVAAPGRKLKFS